MRGSVARHAAPVLAGVVAAFLLSGTALAHDVTFNTRLSISRSPSGTVDPGTSITFSGKLRSPKGRCERSMLIKLIKVGKGIVDKTRTDDRGRYRFEPTVRRTSTWRTRFSGRALDATHPHSHVCEAATSKEVTVPVG